MIKTYLDNRKCDHCGEPIADQEHGLQKFCPRQVLSDGTIKNCKDDYWSSKRRAAMEPFMAIAYLQRAQFDAIDNLFKTKGEIVTLEDLNRSEIDLGKPVQFVNKNSQYTWWFHFYGIQQQPNNHFKIFTHELY